MKDQRTRGSVGPLTKAYATRHLPHPSLIAHGLRHIFSIDFNADFMETVLLVFVPAALTVSLMMKDTSPMVLVEIPQRNIAGLLTTTQRYRINDRKRFRTGHNMS